MTDLQKLKKQLADGFEELHQAGKVGDGQTIQRLDTELYRLSEEIDKLESEVKSQVTKITDVRDRLGLSSKDKVRDNLTNKEYKINNFLRDRLIDHSEDELVDYFEEILFTLDYELVEEEN